LEKDEARKNTSVTFEMKTTPAKLHYPKYLLLITKRTYLTKRELWYDPSEIA
jgi:hypothetical protein